MIPEVRTSPCAQQAFALASRACEYSPLFFSNYYTDEYICEYNTVAIRPNSSQVNNDPDRTHQLA
jgi:hypothetical protein